MEARTARQGDSGWATFAGCIMFIVGSLAIFDRFHNRRQPKIAVAANDGLGTGYFEPAVAVLIPAYNEEKVIERTVRAALRSDYAKLRVIIIDDGSKDRTLEIVTEAFHGSLTPAIFTASAHSGISAAIVAANSSGVLPSGSTP